MQEKIFLGDELTRIWNKVLAGENFALIRSADGEKGLMDARTFTAQEGWKSPKTRTKLAEALEEILTIDSPNFIFGISCPCCDVSGYKWYMEKVKSRNVTFSNIWGNSNYQRFIKGFRELKRDAIVIANHRAEGKPIGQLNVLDYYCVSDDCVAFWEQEAEAMIQKIIREHGHQNDLLYVVSIGPMSGPVIARLFQNNPNNCYLDFGSSVDSFYWEKVTRPYMKPETEYAKQECWMFDPKSEHLKENLNSLKTNALVEEGLLYKMTRKYKFRTSKFYQVLQTVKILPQLTARKIFGDANIEKLKSKLKK